MRPGRAEKKSHVKAARRLMHMPEPAANAMVWALDVGDETLVFLPDGRLFLFHRKSKKRFRACELEDINAAASVGVRWLDEAAETIQ